MLSSEYNFGSRRQYSFSPTCIQYIILMPSCQDIIDVRYPHLSVYCRHIALSTDSLNGCNKYTAPLRLSRNLPLNLPSNNGTILPKGGMHHDKHCPDF